MAATIAVMGALAGCVFGSAGHFDLLVFGCAAIAFVIITIPRVAGWAAIASLLFVATPGVARQVDLRFADGWFTFKRPYWQAWMDVQHWAASHTPQGSMFLVPLDMRLIGFEVGSHRPLWVDVRQGAAALWQPSFYGTWHQRVSEVRALHSLENELRYARSKGIAYVIVWNGGKRHPEYRNAIFSVIKANAP